MKIAVTYENGDIFGHFGHSENFKLYDVADEKIVGSQIIDTKEKGHSALAALLAENGVEVLICGGIGAGAAVALEAQDIRVCAGQSGNADEAVEAYLRGELVDSGVNCDHHSHEDGEDSPCGGSCGSCGGGCGGCHHEPAFSGPNVGKQVRVHYAGTFNDGTQFDSSYDRGEPIEFVCGMGMMIEGFDRAVATMNVGDIVDIHLEPKEAYGEINPNAIFTVALEELPGSEELNVGEQVMLQGMYGPFQVLVKDKDDTTITFDANHEMAGRELNFKIELVEVLI